MLKVSSETGIDLVMEVANSIVNSYKRKGDALEHGYERGLKLLEHVMKTVERIVRASQRKDER